MRLTTAVKMIVNGQFSLMLKLMKTGTEFYRACFVVSAISEGVYAAFTDKRATVDQLVGKRTGISNREGLEAWLELGVSLGELDRSGNEYRIAGKLSLALLDPTHDGYQAFFEEIVKHHYLYVMETPAKLRDNASFPFDESIGRLIARSSRISEPFISAAVDDVVPRRGAFDLLEIGCGSGTYIRHAAARNPELRSVGLELQEQVAVAARENIRNWGLEGRVAIEHCDVRKYESGPRFDLITFHQNIYYFLPAERVALAEKALGFLKPGGRVLITTICRGGGPAAQVLNIWVSTTQGHGRLPDPEELCHQLKDAGFSDVKKKRLMPFESFWAFFGTKP